MEFSSSSAELSPGQKNDEVYKRQPGRTSHPLGELLVGNRHQTGAEAANDLGRILVEVPLGTAERSHVVPFDKKAVDFSREELQRTAEKVQVHGVSLAEMTELGKLDEAGLRRVVQEFLNGGDFAGLAEREVNQRELQFERDPQMRKAGASLLNAVDDDDKAGSSQVAKAAEQTQGGNQEKPGETAHDDKTEASPAKFTGPRPTPDPATLKALRLRQAITIAATIAAVAILILIAFKVTN